MIVRGEKKNKILAKPLPLIIRCVAKSPVGTKAIVNSEGKEYQISAILSMYADDLHYLLIHVYF